MAIDGQQFVKNSMLTFFRQGINIVFGFVLLIVLARLLGPTGQGSYALITLLPTLLLTFLTLGMNTSSIYFISKGEVALQTVYINNLIIGLFLSLLSIGVGIFFVIFFSDLFFTATPHVLLFLCLGALPFLFLREFLQTIFQGLQDFKVFNTAIVLNQGATVIFCSVFLWMCHLGLLGAILAFMIGTILPVGYMLVLLNKKHHLRFSWRGFSKDYFRKAIAYGMKTHISNFASFLNYRLVLFLIGFFMFDAAVGIYVAAMNIGERLAIFASSVSNVLYPKIASIASEEERNRLTSLVSRTILAGTVLVACIGMLLANELIPALFGSRYEESATLLVLLFPGIALLSVEKILSNDLAGRGKPELNMYVSLWNVVFNLGLNTVLIPRFGLKGAALAATITYSFSFMVKVYVYRTVTREPFHRFLLLQKQDFKRYRTFIESRLKA
ncbi:hypothetical protein A374_01659 [Fictibacillus macauensis ZFHKF-1]|uniref:Uncharacterized protein n=1 Tax=Fictibacillus macauensis ZFHKF-1 TaxID=1196324 RepID=I8J540_9BACL|nr:flippase [Fictibacillus macauensis]EIT86921.1 hypothetical protein A374_01659 [Fictibacillus macauensis ZFHKF-1]